MIIEFIELLIKRFQEDLNNEIFEFESLLNIFSELDEKIDEKNKYTFNSSNDELNKLWSDFN